MAGELRAVIERNRLKGREIAEAIGVAPETLSRWVQGHVAPTSDNLLRLLSHLRQYEPGLQVEDLVEASPAVALAPVAEAEP